MSPSLIELATKVVELGTALVALGVAIAAAKSGRRRDAPRRRRNR